MEKKINNRIKHSVIFQVPVIIERYENERSLPLTSVVSVGNGMHLGIEDYLEHLAQEESVGTILRPACVSF